MRIASGEHRTLIYIVLCDGKAQAHWHHGKYNALAQKGFTEVVSKGEIYHTRKLTAAGLKPF